MFLRHKVGERSKPVVPVRVLRKEKFDDAMHVVIEELLIDKRDDLRGHLHTKESRRRDPFANYFNRQRFILVRGIEVF